MQELRRILVPIDFSDASADAAAYAARLAAPGRGELHLLHVLPPPEFGFAMVEPGPERLRDLSADRREEALVALSRLPPELEHGPVLRPHVAEGEPAGEIIRYARHHDLDAVVMPTHGKGRLERLLLIGSVTIKVLHALESPVITAVHFGREQPPAAVRRILCAVDLGPSTERVLCAAVQFAAKFGARLSIAHAASLFGYASGDVYDPGWRDTVVSRVRERLDRLKQQLHVEADTWVELDQPPRAISSLALNLSADLVVLGRGASDGLLGRLRAEAYDIIRLCRCPVVSV